MLFDIIRYMSIYFKLKKKIKKRVVILFLLKKSIFKGKFFLIENWELLVKNDL